MYVSLTSTSLKVLLSHVSRLLEPFDSGSCLDIEPAALPCEDFRASCDGEIMEIRMES